MGSSASTAATPPSSPDQDFYGGSSISGHARGGRGARFSAQSPSVGGSQIQGWHYQRYQSSSSTMDKRLSQQSLVGSDMYASKHCVVRTNKVAPVIIKDCREEFQQISDFTEPIVRGRMTESMLEHPLIKGKYFLVQDSNDTVDHLQTFKQVSAPNYYQAGNDQPVFASGQPTLNGFNTILSQLISDGYSEVLVLNLRGEPVLFQRVDDDYVPYSVRHQDRLHNMVGMGSDRDSSDQVESCIRRDVVSLASMEEEFVFYFYDNMEKLQQEPHMRKVEFEEDILLSAEIYPREAFANPILKYDRICIPEMAIPTEEMVDQFLSHFREQPAFLDRNSRKFPAIYLISHSGGRRSAVFMVMACLIYAHKKGNLKESCAYFINSQNPNYTEGEYLAVQRLVNHLKNGSLIKMQVDTVIDQCAEVINLRKCIAELKKTLEALYANNTVNGCGTVDHVYDETLSALEMYCFFIAFNAYLSEQMSNNLNVPYSKWLNWNPEVLRICTELDLSESKAPAALLSKQSRILVADDYIGLDVLSSHMDVKVSNFRRLMGLPVYGMAQPSRNGLTKVVNHLLHHKQGYSEVIVVNLRNDYVIECDDLTYSVRDASYLAEPVSSVHTTGREMDEAELAIKKEIKSKKCWKIYSDINEQPIEREMNSIITPDEMYQQQKLSTLDLVYRRLPLQFDHNLREEEFDAIQKLILSYMKEDGSWTNNSHAFVFHCRTGKSRTSLVMAVAGLIFYHMTGFPYGANPDEQERVSCPNAKYTKGEFLVTEKLVWLLPDGHQVKREVDLVLDRLFETMSPMHFHLREVILVVFNKARSSTGENQDSLHRMSYDFLERYLYLILYNAYLHMEKCTYFARTFSQWMKEVAAPAGVYELLNKLGFFNLETTTSVYSKRKSRLISREQKLPFTGTFV